MPETKTDRSSWSQRSLDFLAGLSSTRILAALGCLIFTLTVLVFFSERGVSGSGFDNFRHALYWMVVTASTTGYGDITPKTRLGQTLTVFVIISSMIFVSIVTATIASKLVERRLLEGKGMNEVRMKGHLIICGFNHMANSLLDSIYRYAGHAPEIVLVNDLGEEAINEILYTYRDQDLKFVRGDFSQESVLERAGVRHAREMLILADGTIAQGFPRADERALLAALSARSLNPGIRIASELVHPDNRRHLERAGIDPIISYGEGHDFLLASSIVAPGICLAGKELLSTIPKAHLQQVKLPASLEGANFKKVREYFREHESAIAIGLVWEGESGFGLDDVLSEDLTLIDHFLKKQFEGIEHNFFKKEKKIEIKINPPDDFVASKSGWVLLLV
jgi:voltage-gated potassium channel